MSACKWMADMLLAMFTVYLFFLYFGMFFERRKKNIRVLLGIIVLVLWQVGIPEVINELPKAWNIGTTVGLALFVVANVFEGKAWMKGFFAVTFAAIWMLAEMLIGSVLMIYGESIVERQIFGAFASRFLFFLIILALRKVFTNEKVTGLPTGYSILIIFIPTGSIYIMNAVFVLAYRTDWEYAEGYSLVFGLILLFINVLIFYIYIRLADDLRIRRMNLVYEQQLDLCARHQEERELSVLQMRDVRHGMRNHLLSILAYAEKGEREKLIQFVTDIIEDGRLRPSEEINTGNIVTDSLVGYWKKKAEDAGIEFLTEKEQGAERLEKEKMYIKILEKDYLALGAAAFYEKYKERFLKDLFFDEAEYRNYRMAGEEGILISSSKYVGNRWLYITDGLQGWTRRISG